MSKRLRVMSILSDLRIGGGEKRVLCLAKAIDADRFDHQVLSIYQSKASQTGTLDAQFEEAGIRQVPLAFEPCSRLLPTLTSADMIRGGKLTSRILFNLCSALRKHRTDVIDAHHCGASLFGLLAGAVLRIPVVLTDYGVRYWDRPLISTLGRRLLPGSAAILSDSQAQLDVINAFIPRPHPRSYVVPNGIPAARSLHASKEMRQKLGLPLDPHIKIVGQVARLIPGKGQQVLLRAARALVAERRDVFFLLTGFAGEVPSYRDTLEQEIHAMKLEQHVKILSYPGGIEDVWRAIDLHVHPTLCDSLPISIAEGMSNGLPLITTSIGGIPDLVTHEKTGIVIPPNDVDSLVHWLRRLLDAPDFAQQLGAAALERYEQYYRPEVMARRIEQIFVEAHRLRTPSPQ